MKIEYQNDNTVIFMGFYESILYNSDTENILHEYECVNNNEVLDYELYEQTMARYITNLLAKYCTGDVIHSMKYVGIDSPQFYNFITDKIKINVDFNCTKLKKFIKNQKEDFDNYLHDNYTSYDGYYTSIANNIEDFKNQYKDIREKETCLNVMLEYYILSQIYMMPWNRMKQLTDVYDTDYHSTLLDNITEIQVNCMKEEAICTQF